MYLVVKDTSLYRGDTYYCLHYLSIACADISSSSWYSKLEATGWLTHVEQLLRAVKHVVHQVCKEGKGHGHWVWSLLYIGNSVVIHGTTGQDGTLQVSSLSIILMDPQARTIRG